MNVDDFNALLGQHDWYYAYADDYGSFNRGDAQRNVINRMLKEHPDWQPMFDAHMDFIMGNLTREQLIQRKQELVATLRVAQ
jgi:hypothetical protein